MKRFTSQHKRTRAATPLATPGSTLSFNSFTFVDNFTNNKIVLQDAREQYQKHIKHYSTEIQQKIKEVDNLNNCISLLKTTKLFQMDSLRNKLFKSAHHSRHPTLESEEEIEEAKRGLQKIITNSMDQLNRKEFQEWLSHPNKHINSKIMGLQSLSRTNITKNSLMNLINASERHPQIPKILKIHKQNTPIEIKQEKELQQKMQHNIAAMKANNTFLVRPDSQHQLYQKLFTACTRNRTKIKRTTAKIKENNQNDQGVFRPVKVGPKVNELQSKIIQKKKKIVQSDEQLQILNAVENNLFFDMEFMLNTRKSLVHVRDRKGNNLLHIAAKNRNLEFFQFLLKRAGPQALQAKNNLGKTPFDVAKLYGVANIVEAILNYSPFN